jgi:hypothetical protein
MNLVGVPMMLAEKDDSILYIRGQVAQVLLEQAGDNTNRQHRITHRDMATLLNTGWDKIHLSLKSLHEEGAIKIDRNRIIIETKRLQKVAGVVA